MTAWDMLSGKCKIQNRVVIVGGGQVGCETANFLAEENRKIILIEMIKKLAVGMPYNLRSALLENLERKGVEVYTESKLKEVRDKEVIVERSGNRIYF